MAQESVALRIAVICAVLDIRMMGGVPDDANEIILPL